MEKNNTTTVPAIIAITILAATTIGYTLHIQQALGLVVPMPYLLALATNSAIVGFAMHRLDSRNNSLDVTLVLFSIWLTLFHYQTTIQSSVTHALPGTCRTIVSLPAMAMGWIAFNLKDPTKDNKKEAPAN